jgi:hypothetical protein
MGPRDAKRALKSIYEKIFPCTPYYLKRELVGCHSVLDLGCGAGSSIQYCNIPFSVGVELFEPYLEESKEKKIHNQYIKEDVRSVNFEKKSFDAVIALDVIEHLTKAEGSDLMAKMENWARKKIIIFTPNGYVEQDGYDKNEFQQHKCGWSSEELGKLGFRLYGINGPKKLRNKKGAVRYRPKFLWCRIADLAQKIVYYCPKMAFQIFAVKKI